MTKRTIIKLNQKGRGYTHTWLDGEAALATKVVDEALPTLDTNALSPRVAYTTTRLVPNRVFLAVGSYWPRVTDEFSRPGLYLWHGVVCDLPEFAVRQVSELTSMLVGLVQWYEDGYDLVGNLIEEIARGRAEKGWAEAISQFGQVEKGSWDVRDILRPCDLILQR